MKHSYEVKGKPVVVGEEITFTAQIVETIEEVRRGVF